MTAQDVINMGADIEYVSRVYNNKWMAWSIIAIVIVIVIIEVALSKYIEHKGGSDFDVDICIILGVFAIVGTVSWHIYTQHELTNEYQDATTDWLDSYAYPYIKSLDYTDLELTTIRQNDGRQELYGMPYPNEIIEYRNTDQIVQKLGSPQKTAWDATRGRKAYTLIYDVPPGEKQFVRFYELETDLGHGVKPGAYGLDVHLNEKQE